MKDDLHEAVSCCREAGDFALKEPAGAPPVLVVRKVLRALALQKSSSAPQRKNKIEIRR